MTSTLFFLATAVLWVIAFFALRAYIKKRSNRETLLAALTDEVRGLEAELNRITDRDASLIEQRVEELRRLLREADEKTALFQSVIAEMRERQRLLAEAEAKTARAKKELEDAERAYGDKPLTEKIADLQIKGFTIEQIARKLEKTITEIELAIAVRPLPRDAE